MVQRATLSLQNLYLWLGVRVLEDKGKRYRRVWGQTGDLRVYSRGME